MISRLKLIFILLIILCAISGVIIGQPRPTPGSLEQLRTLPTFRNVPKLEALNEAAIKGRNQYQLMVNSDNFKMMGLNRVEDAAKTKLGTPSKDYMVRLDKLKKYKSGDDPAKLLTYTGKVDYPVVFDSKTISTVTVVMKQGKWKVASIGAANRSLKSSIALKKSVSRLNKTEGEHFTVRVPALNVEFKAVRDSSNILQLTPIQDFPEWGLRAGIPEPASNVFLKLVPSAKGHDGLPH